jgi:mRNA-degrading endonuclease RelE of RelBE toxin-antitoxin system
MSYKILPSKRFAKELKSLAKKHSSIKSDFGEFLKELRKNPDLGVPLGNNCYKIRMAIRSKNKGKSEGARLITHIYHSGETVYLLTIYDKSSRLVISMDELKTIIADLALE